ncbi:MAG: MFS transporter [Candidatus Bathyarchaeia archaeon]
MSKTLELLRFLSEEFKVTLFSVAFYSWSISLVIQYVDLFAVMLGVSPALLGLIAGIGQFSSSLASPLMGWYADFHGVKKALIIALILSSCSFGLYSISFSWWMIIPSVILLNVSRMTILPFADIIFVGSTEAHYRAKAIGLTRAFWASLNSSAPLMAALIVIKFGGISVEGIRPLFIVGLFLNLFVLFLISRFLKLKSRNPDAGLHEGRTGGVGKPFGFIKAFEELLGEKRLWRWIVISIVRRLSMSISSAFTYIWMVSIKGADANILGTLGLIGMITWAILQVPVGILADKIGRRKTFFLFEPFLYIGTILLILAQSPEQLILVGILGAFGLMLGTEGFGIGGSIFLPMMILTWEVVPEEKRGRWHGIISFLSFFNLLFSALAGLMWQEGLMIQVLVLPMILEALFVIPLLLTVPEPEQF